VTLFEYLAIAYSLILSFAVIRLVGGLSQVFDAGRRYWIHATYVCLTLFAVLSLFWAHWSTRDLDWTFPAFLVNLAGPATFYFLATTIVPDDPSRVDSWRAHFFSVRVRFFGGFFAYAGVAFFNTTLPIGAPLLHPVRAVQAGVLLVGIAGLATDRPATHRFILLLAGVVVAITVAVLLRPGSLAA
jgi:hypothetical protein